MLKTNTASNTNALTELLTAGNEKYAYRRLGSGSQPPLLCLQHFTGTLDNWDPAVTDALAQRGDASEEDVTLLNGQTFSSLTGGTSAYLSDS
jgi:hypothetical protein